MHPRRPEVLGHKCVPSLTDIPAPVDLVLLGVPERALVEQLALASSRGDAGAVIFGSAHGLSEKLRSAAGDTSVCGAGCMGFVNVVEGVRAIGYLERSPMTAGSIAVVTHSGSAFAALLRTHRRLEFSLVVSSGQELVTTTADYLEYALELPQTAVVGLLLETLRDVPKLRTGLRRAAERDIPVVALTVGGSPTGRAMVNAHSGALAGDDGAWEALFAAHGVHRAADLDELADTLEMFAIGRRVKHSTVPLGIATVHDSGAERALVADVSHDVGVPFAAISTVTRDRLTGLLEEGLEGDNPLDVWGTGSDTERLFTDCMSTLADDDSVGVVALAVDLVEEYDGDASYPLAAQATLGRTTKPLVVLSNSAAAVDQQQAGPLRDLGVPVLEGTRSGLRALGHLLAQRQRPPAVEVTIDGPRQARWRSRLTASSLDALTSFELLESYGVPTATPRLASSLGQAVEIAESLRYPVVVKTGEPEIAHKTDVGGVFLGLETSDDVSRAFIDLSQRLGPRVLVQPQVSSGVELALGIVRDPLLGPLVLVAAGGTLVELLSRRCVALPPLNQETASTLLDTLDASSLLSGVRGRVPADRQSVIDAVVAVSQLAVELGDVIDALDVNPLIVTPLGALAVDSVVVSRRP